MNIHYLPVWGEEKSVSAMIHCNEGSLLSTWGSWNTSLNPIHLGAFTPIVSSPAWSPLAPSQPQVSVKLINETFPDTPVGESKCRVLQPSIPSASPTVQHSDLLIYYVCSLSHEDRDFFSLVSALSPASRTHSEMEVLRNYTLSDEETDACPLWGTVRSILHEGRKTTQP